MQYIGRIFSSAKRMYSDINSATLSGAIDVLVVRYPDGELVSSPFYVQFGKTGVFRPCADEVEVMINGVPRPDIRMRVNRYGQAYFDDPEYDLRPCSPNLDSGINLADYQSSQSPPTSETCYSPPPPETMNVTLNSEASASVDGKTDLLQSVPTLVKNADYSEFESNLQWWNEDNSASKILQIRLYTLTDEQSKAADPNAQSTHDSVWVYWENKWYSWRTANIKLRFLRNLGSGLPRYFEILDSKLMEMDRENPAFILLPESPPSFADEDKEDLVQFDLEQSENPLPSRISMFKPSTSVHDDSQEMLVVDLSKTHPSSLPGTPPKSPSHNELAYFSDGHSPKDVGSDLGSQLNWRLQCQWDQSYNTRAFKLSSNDIKRLDLVDGTNEAVFTTTNKYQGTCTCYCLIYVWNSSDKIVISDIDGTITKSDLLGHVMHLVGLEWTQEGVIPLYRKISENGFRMMYLSARSIGQANPTRNLLEGLQQGNESLPAGPIILSPNSLITTIQMEIIQKRPQVLKISNLKRLGELFRQQNQSDYCPFYAGFGNRFSDVETYRAIGIPDSRIFIVNPEGVIETPTGLRMPAGYKALFDIVDNVFPPDNEKLAESDYSDFSYWRDQLPGEF